MQKITLSKECETLFIPLHGKSLMSKAGQLIADRTAERIVDSVDYDFSKNKMPKGLQLYMAIRACILDDYANRFIQAHADAVVIHLGCGLDARCERVARKPGAWYDLDFPDVIAVRRQFYPESEGYHMIASDAVELSWLDRIERKDAPTLVIAEGMTMYLTEAQIRALVLALRDRFEHAELVFDAYSVGSVKLSKRHNPVNKMGAVIRWGLDDPAVIERFGAGIRHLETRYFTNYPGLRSLPFKSRLLFSALYKNPIVKNMYRIYAFGLKRS